MALDTQELSVAEVLVPTVDLMSFGGSSRPRAGGSPCLSPMVHEGQQAGPDYGRRSSRDTNPVEFGVLDPVVQTEEILAAADVFHAVAYSVKGQPL